MKISSPFQCGKISWRRERLPLQYSGLENSTYCIVHGVTKNQRQLSDISVNIFEVLILLSVTEFENIFSLSSVYIFILLMVSLGVQKLLSSTRFHLLNFLLLLLIKETNPKRYDLLCFMSKSVLMTFSSNSKTFMVPDLKFGSLTHFEFIFLYDIRKCSNFFLLHVTVQFSQDHLWK